MIDITALIGKTLSDVKNIDNEEIRFTTEDGDQYRLYHEQDCCEHVRVDDVCGDLSDLIGSPILKAEERSNSSENGADESYTWTFYELATIKGSVTIKWYGSSNGYYSESVDFSKIET